MRKLYSTLLAVTIALTLGGGWGNAATASGTAPLTQERNVAPSQDFINGGWVDSDHWYVFSTTFKSLDACRRMGTYQVNHGDNADIFGAYRCEGSVGLYALKLFYYEGVV